MMEHQYIEGSTFALRTEYLYRDRVIRFIYSRVREDAPFLFRLLTSKRASSLIAFLNYDFFLSRRVSGIAPFFKASAIDRNEWLDPPEMLDTPKKIFERKIRYWHCRPMPDQRNAVVSPADSRMLVGSLANRSALFLKDKFFELEELVARSEWVKAFEKADFAVFRLTPDKYHYNHMPVSGRVVDFYEISGAYHSCNPGAVVTVVTPYSKNARVVTIIDTEVTGGTGAGLVAVIEVVALMIGKVHQRYSEHRYEGARPVEVGMFLEKGCPKSLYEPGSSTDILLFQPGRVRFDTRIVTNMHRPMASSRFTEAFGKPLLETEVKVRSLIGLAQP
ncbi:MAG: Phosphatidylserine decarboxylase proenzyme [Syntrophorhabdaceae bacterium PtaU1.Bin034]|nr:MAG: Phosphatidylserine decarboxylase proenzyme [Syntrophorhabdaceae bacterium PtaU1.Bin034]